MFGRESNYISLKLSKICKIPNHLSLVSVSSPFPLSSISHESRSETLPFVFIVVMTHFYKSIWSSQRSSTHQSFGNICCFLTTIPKWIIPILVSVWPVHLSAKEALEAMESRQWLTTLSSSDHGRTPCCLKTINESFKSSCSRNVLDVN